MVGCRVRDGLLTEKDKRRSGGSKLEEGTALTLDSVAPVSAGLQGSGHGAEWQGLGMDLEVRAGETQ